MELYNNDDDLRRTVAGLDITSAQLLTACV